MAIIFFFFLFILIQKVGTGSTGLLWMYFVILPEGGAKVTCFKCTYATLVMQETSYFLWVLSFGDV